MNKDFVLYDGLKGFESDWYISSRKKWVKVWESVDENVAMSVVPIPSSRDNSKESLAPDTKNPITLLTIGLNPRSYEEGKGAEDIRSVYKEIIKEHSEYKKKNLTSTKNKRYKEGGGLDMTRKKSINLFDELSKKNDKEFSQIDRLIQIDIFPYRTYTSSELSNYLKETKKDKVRNALTETLKTLKKYSKESTYILAAWGASLGTFIQDNQDIPYMTELKKALSSFSEYLNQSPIKEKVVAGEVVKKKGKIKKSKINYDFYYPRALTSGVSYKDYKKITHTEPHINLEKILKF